MKIKASNENGTQAEITLTLPDEVTEDLEKIASFNKTRLEDLVFSYIVEGLAGDSLAVKRMEFTENANGVLGKNNIPSKTVEDLFKNLVY